MLFVHCVRLCSLTLRPKLFEVYVGLAKPDGLAYADFELYMTQVCF
jgi:hypothetical protein